jgi:Uma2 family endonuclease
MAEALPKPWTVEDFLEWEARQPERYEFVDGMILGMVGGSVAHAAIKDNITGALRARLRGTPCRAFSESLKVVTNIGSHYPDVVVTCVPMQPTDDRVREPVVVVEVLSRTTADRDRSAKWVGYQDVPSLQHYVLVAQDRRRVELFTRTGDTWNLMIIRPPRDRVALPAIGAELTLAEIYEDSGA